MYSSWLTWWLYHSNLVHGNVNVLVFLNMHVVLINFELHTIAANLYMQQQCGWSEKFPWSLSYTNSLNSLRFIYIHASWLVRVTTKLLFPCHIFSLHIRAFGTQYKHSCALKTSLESLGGLALIGWMTAGMGYLTHSPSNFYSIVLQEDIQLFIFCIKFLYWVHDESLR